MEMGFVDIDKFSSKNKPDTDIIAPAYFEMWHTKIEIWIRWCKHLCCSGWEHMPNEHLIAGYFGAISLRFSSHFKNGVRRQTDWSPPDPIYQSYKKMNVCVWGSTQWSIQPKTLTCFIGPQWCGSAEEFPSAQRRPNADLLAVHHSRRVGRDR